MFRAAQQFHILVQEDATFSPDTTAVVQGRIAVGNTISAHGTVFGQALNEDNQCAIKDVLLNLLPSSAKEVAVYARSAQFSHGNIVSTGQVVTAQLLTDTDGLAFLKPDCGVLVPKGNLINFQLEFNRLVALSDKGYHSFPHNYPNVHSSTLNSVSSEIIVPENLKATPKGKRWHRPIVKFLIDCADLANLYSYTFTNLIQNINSIDHPMFIITITGDATCHVTNLGPENYQLDEMNRLVVWNFVGTELILDGDIVLHGSLIAPRATVHTRKNTVVKGQVYAKSLVVNGNSRFEYFKLDRI